MQNPYLKLNDEVRTALAEKRAVVALESTVISHGLPYPQNIEIAHAMEAAIRAEGAVPATIAIRDGKILVGLNEEDIELLATAKNVAKVSRRDLAFVLSNRQQGATTVAGTMLCANYAGIRFFATGGIGGVHRGAELSMDISADLTEFGRTPVLVTCAGAKSILDLELTLEYLETQGVPVVGWQTDELPAFYVRSSGRSLHHRLDSIEQIARFAHTQWTCNLNGIILTCPIPHAFEMQLDTLEAATQEALSLAHQQHIQGSALTPFLLSQVARITAGESVEANQALLLNNATIAAHIAIEYQKQRHQDNI